MKVSGIDIAGTESILAFGEMSHRDAHRLQQVNQVIDIENIGQVVHYHFILRKQHGTKHLQCFVFRPLWGDTAVQFVSAFYNKTCHIVFVF